MTRKPVELAPGRSQKDSYVVFIGPKRPDLLAQYKAANDPNYSLKDIIYYGMWPFGAVARGMLSVLHFFYSIVGNYGIAIIMLTVLVRGCMFPISFKQTQNMARMQALKPELDRINEKYKTDMQKRSQAMQELYRKHKINPLGGCLPVFLQLPIFIGLYRSIMVDVELRQSPLFGHCDPLVLRSRRARHALQLVVAHAAVRQQRRRHLRPRARISTSCRSSRSRCSWSRRKCRCPSRRTNRPSCSRR